MSNKQLILKVIGTPEHINSVIDFFPTDAIQCISEKKVNSESYNVKHQFIHLNPNVMSKLVEVQKEVGKQFMEGEVR